MPPSPSSLEFCFYSLQRLASEILFLRRAAKLSVLYRLVPPFIIFAVFPPDSLRRPTWEFYNSIPYRVEVRYDRLEKFTINLRRKFAELYTPAYSLCPPIAKDYRPSNGNTRMSESVPDLPGFSFFIFLFFFFEEKYGEIKRPFETIFFVVKYIAKFLFFFFLIRKKDISWNLNTISSDVINLTDIMKFITRQRHCARTVKGTRARSVRETRQRNTMRKYQPRRGISIVLETTRIVEFPPFAV